jgi:glycosyltransferase involved in cell wall biosynthesis
MKNLKFSIITPSHEYQDYINELYESILEQTYENWEWVLFLNGKFKKEELNESILSDNRVKIHTYYGENTNIGYIKNKAFHLGTGDVLVEVDHDDMITNDCLFELNKAFQDDEIDFVYSDNAKLKMDGEFIPYNPLYGWTYDKFNWKGKELITMNSFEPSSQSISYIWFAPDHVRSWRTSFYKKIGGHNPEYSVCDDHELMIRTYLETKMLRIPKTLYIYRITGDNSWLKRNDDVQKLTKELHNKWAQKLAERDADLKGLLKVDLGGGLFPRKDYLTIDQEGAEINCDLNNGIPLDDNSVGVINASHLVEHLREPLKIMSEIHRVLAPGGWAFIEVPSTDGRGAWQDPTHVSYWNENSFFYYTKKSQAQYIRNDKIRFSSMRLETNWWVNNVAVVNTHLVALKDGMVRLPGSIEI